MKKNMSNIEAAVISATGIGLICYISGEPYSLAVWAGTLIALRSLTIRKNKEMK